MADTAERVLPLPDGTKQVKVHGQRVIDNSVWLVRVYYAAKPAHRLHPKHYPATPAKVDFEIAQARIDDTWDDEDDCLMLGVTWMRFGSEIPITNEYSGKSRDIQPIMCICEIDPVETGRLFKNIPLPEGWAL